VFLNLESVKETLFSTFRSRASPLFGGSELKTGAESLCLYSKGKLFETRSQQKHLY